MLIPGYQCQTCFAIWSYHKIKLVWLWTRKLILFLLQQKMFSIFCTCFLFLPFHFFPKHKYYSKWRTFKCWSGFANLAEMVTSWRQSGYGGKGRVQNYCVIWAVQILFGLKAHVIRNTAKTYLRMVWIVNLNLILVFELKILSNVQTNIDMV